MRVKEIMKSSRGSKTKVTVSPDENIDNAALLMSDNNMSSISVVDKGKVVGVITKDDLIKNSDDINEDFFLD